MAGQDSIIFDKQVYFSSSRDLLDKEQQVMVVSPPNERQIDRRNDEVPLHLEPGPLVQPDRRVPRLPRLQVDRVGQLRRPLHVVENGQDQP